MTKLIRLLTVVLATLLSTALMAQETQLYITDSNYLNDHFSSQILEKNDRNEVLVSLTDKEYDIVSEAIHAQTGKCGGLMEADEISLTHFNSPIDLSFDLFAFNDLSPQYEDQVTTVLNSLDQEKYLEHLTGLTQFPNRSARTAQGEMASQWVEEKFQSIANEFSRLDATTFTVSSGRRYKQNNVIAVIPGNDPNLEGVLIGGHMDTLTRNMPGVDDDASGVSAIIEIYRAILQTGLRFERTLYFSAYGAEEVGLIGSKEVVKHFVRNNLGVRSVMQLDMIGYEPSSASGNMYFVRDYTDNSLTEFTKRLAASYLGKTESQLKDLKCGYACSDHARWYNSGFKAVTPFETSYNSMNPHIHSRRDTLKYFSVNHAMQFVRLGASFMVELADPIVENPENQRVSISF